MVLGLGLGQWKRHRLPDAPGDGCHVLDALPGDQMVTGLHRIQQPEVHWIHVARRGEAIHLPLMSETGLDDAETPHRTTRQMIRSHRVSVHHGVLTPIRTLGMSHGVDQNRRRRRGIGTAVEHESRLDLTKRSIPVGVVTHPDSGRMPMNVTDEALRSRIGRPHRAAGHQCEEADMDLKRDVLSSTEGTANPTQGQLDSFLIDTEAGRDLATILMKPLGRHKKLHPRAVGVGNGDGCLETEERLILHADLVGALNDDLTDEIAVTSDDPLMSNEISIGMNRLECSINRPLGIEERFEHLVGHDNELGRSRAGLSVRSRHRRDRFTDEPHLVDSEHRLV